MNANTYRLFLDDTRTPSTEWTLVRTIKDFKQTLEEQGVPEYVSLDYDLEKTDPVHTGLDALEILLAYLNKNSEAFATSDTPAVKLSFHSSSAAFRKSMNDTALQWLNQNTMRPKMLIIQQPEKQIQNNYWKRIKP